MSRAFRIWFALVLLQAPMAAGMLLLPGQMIRWEVVGAAMAARAGEMLFLHDWQSNDPLCPQGDGLGPVYNATSCVACHHQPRLGGSGGLEHNVTIWSDRHSWEPREGIVHTQQPAAVPPKLQMYGLSSVTYTLVGYPVTLSQRNPPALFGAKLIDDIPEPIIHAEARNQRLKWEMASPDDESVPVGRAQRLPNGRLGRFGWKAQKANLSDFVRDAAANELGLSNPGHTQPMPCVVHADEVLGETWISDARSLAFLHGGACSFAPSLDLTAEQCNQLTAFCASLPRPVERLREDVTAERAASGKRLFNAIGCADCHTPTLGSVDGIYSDLLLHRMGAGVADKGSYWGQMTVWVASSEGSFVRKLPGDEWRTPPLWGVADSAPYLHDGRAATLRQAIEMHGGGGQGARAARNFESLSGANQAELIAFLKTLRAPLP